MKLFRPKSALAGIHPSALFATLAMTLAGLTGNNALAQTVAPPSEPQRLPAMERIEFGKLLVMQRCSNCHAVAEDDDRYGAPLHHLFGRKAGSVEGKTYSQNIKNLGIAWSPETLDNWLEQTTFDTPDIRMRHVGIPREDQRLAVIAYLKSLPGNSEGKD